MKSQYSFIPQHSEKLKRPHSRDPIKIALWPTLGCDPPVEKRWSRLFTPQMKEASLMSVCLCTVWNIESSSEEPQRLTPPSSHTSQRTCWRWKGWIWKSRSQSRPATSSVPPGWETPKPMLFWTRVREPSVKHLHRSGRKNPSGKRTHLYQFKGPLLCKKKKKKVLSCDPSQNDLKVRSVKFVLIYKYIHKSVYWHYN